MKPPIWKRQLCLPRRTTLQNSHVCSNFQAPPEVAISRLVQGFPQEKRNNGFSYTLGPQAHSKPQEQRFLRVSDPCIGKFRMSTPRLIHYLIVSKNARGLNSIILIVDSKQTPPHLLTFIPFKLGLCMYIYTLHTYVHISIRFCQGWESNRNGNTEQHDVDSQNLNVK